MKNRRSIQTVYVTAAVLITFLFCAGMCFTTYPGYAVRILFEGIGGIIICLLGYRFWKKYEQETSIVWAMLIGTILLIMLYFVSIGFFHFDFEYTAEWSLGVMSVLAPAYITYGLYRLLYCWMRREVYARITSFVIGFIFVVGCCAATGSGLELTAIIWLAESAVMAMAMKYEKKTQWKAWIICMLLAIFMLAQETEFNTEWMLTQYYISEKLLIVLCPLLYTFLFRYIQEKIGKEKKEYSILLYYFICILLFVSYYGLFYNGIEINRSVIAPMYLLVFSVIVLISENGSKKIITVLGSLLYLGLGMIFVFFKSERLREIIYSCGGPAINIEATDRADWLGYRLSGLKTFMTGDFAYMEEAEAINNWNGYVQYMDGYWLNPHLFQFPRWILYLIAAVIVGLAVILIRMKCSDMKWNRIKNCIAAGYLIRTGIALVSVIFMFTSSQVYFPLVGFNITDILIFVFVLRKAKEGKRQ